MSRNNRLSLTQLQYLQSCILRGVATHGETDGYTLLNTLIEDIHSYREELARTKRNAERYMRTNDILYRRIQSIRHSASWDRNAKLHIWRDLEEIGWDIKQKIEQEKQNDKSKP